MCVWVGGGELHVLANCLREQNLTGVLVFDCVPSTPRLSLIITV